MTSEPQPETLAPPPTQGQRIAAGALLVAMTLWAAGAWAVGMIISSFSGAETSFVGYAMGAALVVGMPLAVLFTQGPRSAGVAWGVFVGLAVLFVPTCGFLLEM